ncbi:Ppx/GppA family phosphatase [Evansella sp. AB-rgal1]|uniref:Ppx/GppA phosphatase family protein n=1 Tax=Evansella sp. AB-rgal1 TaxID=3242696 RepID=UPI00359CD428
MKPQQIGIIDMGSNSIRFVIYDINEVGCIKQIQNLKVVARLSSYIDEKGNMTSEGIETILHTLERFSIVASNYELSIVRGVATAAIRNANNQDEILQAIREQDAFQIQVLSDKEEAYYGYLAVTNSTDIINGITIDIGGGSTEVTLFENRELFSYHSFPFGAITLKKFIHNDPPTREELNTLREYVRKEYETLSWTKNRGLPVIGIGGSARNIASIHQRQQLYPLSGLHQYEMEKTDIHFVNRSLITMSLKERQQLEGLSKDRADIIIPAAIAIEELLNIASASSFIVSNKGLRDGLFSELYLKPIGIRHYPNVAEESFYQLSQDYSLDLNFQKKIAILATFLAKELINNIDFSLKDRDIKLLQWSARIYFIGGAIHPESKSQHTFYLLTNQTIDGLNHKERLAIACIASFKSKSQLKQYLSPFQQLISDEDRNKFEVLGAILKLCYALNYTNRNVIESLRVKKLNTEKCIIELTHSDDVYFEEFQANKNKRHLEKALGIQFELTFIPV